MEVNPGLNSIIGQKIAAGIKRYFFITLSP
jgi:hypothetical protein